MDWLVDFATRHWVKKADEFDRIEKIQSALLLLSVQTGIQSIVLESALVDPAAPADTIIIPRFRVNEPRVRLLSNFTDEQWSYQRRPSQAQVDQFFQRLLLV